MIFTGEEPLLQLVIGIDLVLVVLLVVWEVVGAWREHHHPHHRDRHGRR